MDEKQISDMSDDELLDMMVPQLVSHSDYTVAESDARRILRIMNFIKDKKGIVTVDDARLHIKNAYQLGEVIRLCPGEQPLWLEELSIGVIKGQIKLTGGQFKATNGLDLVGLFDELVGRFGFPKGKVYKALAKHLEKPGHDEPSDNNGQTIGGESVRQDIGKLRKQLNKFN